jgi:hypothetical protein
MASCRSVWLSLASSFPAHTNLLKQQQTKHEKEEKETTENNEI